MDTTFDIWHVPVIFGAGILSVLPVLPAPGLGGIAYAVAVAVGSAIWVRAMQIVNGEVTARYGDRLPGVMTTRDWSLSALIAYVYVGWSVTDLVSVEGPTATLVVIAALYAAGIAVVVASVKIVYAYVTAGRRPASY